MSKPYNVVSDLLDLYWDGPVAFAEDMMGFDPDDWQRDVMMDVIIQEPVSDLVRVSGKQVLKLPWLSGFYAAVRIPKWYVQRHQAAAA